MEENKKILITFYEGKDQPTNSIKDYYHIGSTFCLNNVLAI